MALQRDSSISSPPLLCQGAEEHIKPPRQGFTIYLHHLYINIRTYTYKDTKPLVKSFWFADDTMGSFPLLLSHCVRCPCQVTRETKTSQLIPSTLPGNIGVVTPSLDPPLAFSICLIKIRKSHGCYPAWSHLAASPVDEAAGRGGR